MLSKVIQGGWIILLSCTMVKSKLCHFCSDGLIFFSKFSNKFYIEGCINLKKLGMLSWENIPDINHSILPINTSTDMHITSILLSPCSDTSYRVPLRLFHKHTLSILHTHPYTSHSHNIQL